MIARSRSYVLQHLTEHYFTAFLHEGGSIVKVICAQHEAQRELFGEELVDEASSHGFLAVDVRASSERRLHLVQHLFHGIAIGLPWNAMATQYARRLLECEYDLPDGDLTTSSVATANDVSPEQVGLTIQKQLYRHIIKSPNYSRQFKSVVVALVGSALAAEDIDRARGQRVIEWMCGLPVLNPILLKQANLTRRIDRQTGRSMLLDLSRWSRDCGFPGLVAYVDIAPYSVSRSSGGAFTPAATLELFEVVRQFIDHASEAQGLSLFFSTSRAFLEDARQGIAAYDALRQRIIDDVYDRSHPNLFSPLLMLAHD